MDGKSKQKTPSDALREWVRRARADEHMSLRELDAIADRIDSELVELPTSADGRAWDGSEYGFWTGAWRGEYHDLHDLVLRPGGWYVEDDCGNRYAAESVWRERPDSWERIADELEAWCDGADVDGDACDTPRDLAERIRKLAKVDE